MKTLILLWSLCLAVSANAQAPFCAICGPVTPVSARYAPDVSRPTINPAVEDEQPVILAPIVGGLVGGVVGSLALGALLFEVGGGSEIRGDDPKGLASGALGLMLGEMVGVAVGVHFGNNSRGVLGADVAVSMAAPLVVGGVLSRVSDQIALPAALLAQIGLTVAQERSSGKHLPQGDGGIHVISVSPFRDRDPGPEN